MPRAKIEWHDVWVGAAVTAVLFTLGKFLIGLYIGRSAVASSFGAAGSLVVVMIWVYYSAQIFLLGAEFTWVYAHSHGSRRGEKRPGAPVDEMDQPKRCPPALAPVRLAPAPVPPLPCRSRTGAAVLKRKPLVHLRRRRRARRARRRAFSASRLRHPPARARAVVTPQIVFARRIRLTPIHSAMLRAWEDKRRRRRSGARRRGRHRLLALRGPSRRRSSSARWRSCSATPPRSCARR